MSNPKKKAAKKAPAKTAGTPATLEAVDVRSLASDIRSVLKSHSVPASSFRATFTESTCTCSDGRTGVLVMINGRLRCKCS